MRPFVLTTHEKTGAFSCKMRFVQEILHISLNIYSKNLNFYLQNSLRRYIMYPRIIFDLAKLEENVSRMADACHERGLSCGFVTKCICADKRAADMLQQTAVDFLADSRIENLARIGEGKPRYLLRIAMPGEVDEVIRHADISQQSEIRTVQLLGKAAKAQGKRHKVVLMVDMGDLREGVFFQNRDDLFALAAAVLEEEALELYGVGVNLSCFGGILPDETNLGGLVEAAEAIREKFGVPLPFVSGGNTSSVSMLLEGRIPKGITNLRIGEGILLGNDTSGLKPIPLYHRDCFTLEAELAEVKIKPSKPIGPVGTNAFGEVVEFPDRGIMKRGILAIGRQDVFPDDLTPRDGEVEILGASSDHLIVNLTDAKRDYKVGDILSFDVNYGALLRLCTSEYVKRTYKTTDRSAVKV